MSRNRHSILSITSGRSRLGVAVFHNGSLIYYSGKSLRQFRSESGLLHAVRKILAKLIERYAIQTVLVPELNPQQRHSTGVILIDTQIESFLRGQGLSVRKYDPLTVRRSLCVDSKPTKLNTARVLTKRYAELNRFRFDESEWERRYYGYVFGAIAGGEVFNKNHQIFTINGRSDRVAERVGEKRI